MTSITAVLFDFGMVLSAPPDPATWEAMKQVAGLDQQTFHHSYWAHRDEYDRGTLNWREYWEAIAKAGGGTGFSEDVVEELVKLDVALWTELNEPMIAWLRRLHEAGIRTGILSNMPDAMERGICDKFDWVGDFHHTVWSHALKLRKPEPEIYAAASAGLGVPPQQILFIDDKRENIEAAEAFGMQGIVYASHADFEEEMRQRGYQYLLNAVPNTLTR